MQWYYSKNGTQLGPVAEAELRAKLASGEISQSDLIWKEGMTDWLPAAKVPDMALATNARPSVGDQSDQVTPSYPPSVAAPYQAPHPMGANIPNYLWQSIVVTILCCWPFGIPAIVHAAKVDGLVARGDIGGAMAASKNAKTWITVSIGVWVVLVVIYILIAVFTTAFAQ